MYQKKSSLSQENTHKMVLCFPEKKKEIWGEFPKIMTVLTIWIIKSSFVFPIFSFKDFEYHHISIKKRRLELIRCCFLLLWLLIIWVLSSIYSYIQSSLYPTRYSVSVFERFSVSVFKRKDGSIAVQHNQSLLLHWKDISIRM